MKRIMLLAIVAMLCFVSCQKKPHQEVPCADALIAYAEQYPIAEAQDLYKLVFQDLYGPGHLLTDSAACAHYIAEELIAMSNDTTAMIDNALRSVGFEYTLCDSNYVRVDLGLVAKDIITIEGLTSAVMRSAEGAPTPDPRFVLSHSNAFRKAYHPHYRIVRRDIFESKILPLITKN